MINNTQLWNLGYQCTENIYEQDFLMSVSLFA